VINWGRYGEIFEYDYTSGILSLPKDDEGDDGEPDVTIGSEEPAAP
jgi:hypothetical protein